MCGLPASEGAETRDEDEKDQEGTATTAFLPVPLGLWTPAGGGCVVWCGVVWCGVVWCGVVWCGVVWCGVVWCGVV